MVFGYTFLQILLIVISVAIYFSLFVDFNRILKYSKASYILFASLLLFVYLILLKIGGTSFLIESILALFIFWMVLFGFNINRKHIYLLAILFLIAVPFLLSIHLDKVAEYIAVLAYFCIVLGVLKDIFYEKIYS